MVGTAVRNHERIIAHASDDGLEERVSGAEDLGDERDDVDGEPDDGDTRPVGKGMAECGIPGAWTSTPLRGEIIGDEAMGEYGFVLPDRYVGDAKGSVSVISRDVPHAGRSVRNNKVV